MKTCKKINFLLLMVATATCFRQVAPKATVVETHLMKDAMCIYTMETIIKMTISGLKGRESLLI